MSTEMQPLTATLVLDTAKLAVIEQNLTALSVAQSWVIDDSDTADVVSGEANKAKAILKAIQADYEEYLIPIQMLKDKADRQYRPVIDNVKAAIVHYGTLLVDWRTKEQKRIAAENAAREEEARKLRAEAEAKAQAELARAAEITRQKEEQARRESEARQKAEDDARAAAAARAKAIADGDKAAAAAAAKLEAAARQEAQARAAAEAKAMEQSRAAADEGAAKAQQLTLEAEAQATAMPAEEMREVAGTTFRTKWVAVRTVSEDEAKKAIVAAATARPELLGLLKLDETAIGRMATALKSSFNVPGYKAEQQAGAAKARGA